jgi:hypothetical protein
MMLMLVMMGRQLGVADPRCSQNRNLSACEIQRKKKKKKKTVCLPLRLSHRRNAI